MEYLPLFNLSLIVVNADLSLGKGDIITERAVSREDNKPSHLNQANAVYSVAEQNLFFGGSPAVTKIAPPPHNSNVIPCSPPFIKHFKKPYKTTNLVMFVTFQTILKPEEVSTTFVFV